jgi:ABC-type transporter Mla MlaB component
MDANAAPWAVIALVVDDRAVPIGAVSATARCDIGTLDSLLRLCLAARRQGLSIRLTAVHRDLRELAELAGVTDQLGIA